MQDLDWETQVVDVFKEIDTGQSGLMDRGIIGQMLLTIGGEQMTQQTIDILMLTFDGKSTGDIRYEPFLQWCIRGHPDRKQDFWVRAPVEAEDGTRLLEVEVCPYNSVTEVKRRISKAAMKVFNFDAAPVQAQQLMINGKMLQDGGLLKEGTGALQSDTRFRLRLSPPVPMLFLDLACLVDSENKEMLRSSLSKTFSLWDIDGTLRLGAPSMSRPGSAAATGRPGSAQSTASRQRTLPSSTRLGSPLWSLPQIRSTPQRLALTAQWLLDNGADRDLVCHGRSVVEQCCLHASASVLRVLFSTPPGLDDLSIDQAVQGLTSISHWMRVIIDADLGVMATLSDADPAEYTRMLLAQLEVASEKANEVLDFMEMLRRDLLPNLELPADLFQRAALLRECDGATELTLSREVGAPACSLLVAAAHSGHCWMLAELVRRGVTWSSTSEPSLSSSSLPGGLTQNEVLDVAAAQEAEFRRVLKVAELRLAVLRGDTASLSRLLAQVGADPSWCESLLITALRCGVSAEVIHILLQSTQLDPNVGLYSYFADTGRFELTSPLGWLASGAGRSQEAAHFLFQHLVADPRVDLEFGRILGAQSPESCCMATPVQLCHAAEEWHWLHRLLRAGAPLTAAPKGRWSQHPPIADAGAWFAALELKLYELSKDKSSSTIEPPKGAAPARRRPAGTVAKRTQQNPPYPSPSKGSSALPAGVMEQAPPPLSKGEAAEKFLAWLREVRQPRFSFVRLAKFPPPFQIVAASLKRGLVDRPARGRGAWPQRALERVLSFIGFWEFPHTRRSASNGLRLRRVDRGYDALLGYLGCPVRAWEVQHGRAQLCLGAWAEEVYRGSAPAES